MKVKTLNLKNIGGPERSWFNADDDMLQFMDSVRDSVVSYFNKNNLEVMDEFAPLDTPTRILNNSNEFLPITYQDDLHNLSSQKSVSASMGGKKKKDEVITPRHEMKKQKEKLQELI